MFSKISTLALAIISLSAVAAAQEEPLAYAGFNFAGPMQALVMDDCTNLHLRRLVSINIPVGTYCTMFSSPDCNPSAYTICTIDRPYGDLLSYPGACPDEAGRAKSAIGYTVKSLYCGRSSRDE